MRLFWLISFLAAVAVVVSSADTSAGTVPSGELLRLLDRADREYERIHDYTSVMLSRERVRGALLPEERILLKFQRTFKVYMRWMDGPGRGREGLYVAGAYEGKFLVYEPSGIQRLFTAALAPTDARVMDKSRHPVTDIGIGRLLEIVGENARRAARAGVIRVIDRGVVDLAERRVRHIESVLPRDPRAGYYGYRVELFFDEQYGLPIRVIVFDWQDQLVEDYTYTELRLNPGLSTHDFDPSNKAYGFSFWRIPVPG